MGNRYDLLDSKSFTLSLAVKRLLVNKVERALKYNDKVVLIISKKDLEGVSCSDE